LNKARFIHHPVLTEADLNNVCQISSSVSYSLHLYNENWPLKWNHSDYCWSACRLLPDLLLFNPKGLEVAGNKPGFNSWSPFLKKWRSSPLHYQCSALPLSYPSTFWGSGTGIEPVHALLYPSELPDFTPQGIRTHDTSVLVDTTCYNKSIQIATASALLCFLKHW